MNRAKMEHLWASLLWGGVAGIGQYTMLLLTIIRRIHVSFPGNTPTFSVDPRGPLVLSKATALTSVWVLSLAYAVTVALLVYFRPHLRGNARWLFAVLGVVLSSLAALADPWWGLVVLVDSVVAYWILASPQGLALPF